MGKFIKLCWVFSAKCVPEVCVTKELVKKSNRPETMVKQASEDVEAEFAKAFFEQLYTHAYLIFYNLNELTLKFL